MSRTWGGEFLNGMPAPLPDPAADPVMVRYNAGMQAALAIANDPKAAPYLKKKAAPWVEMSRLQLTRNQIAAILPHLPDPSPKRGRRRGSTPATLKRLATAADRYTSGEKRHTAGRKALKDDGVKGGGTKGQADYLASLIEKRPD